MAVATRFRYRSGARTATLVCHLDLWQHLLGLGNIVRQERVANSSSRSRKSSVARVMSGSLSPKNLQLPQRQVVVARGVAGHRTLPGSGHPQVLPGRFRVCPTKLLRVLEREGFRFPIRIKAKAVLGRKIAPLLKRPVSWPSRQPRAYFASFLYQAESWQYDQRTDSSNVTVLSLDNLSIQTYVYR
jgi:hypothetical protein